MCVCVHVSSQGDELDRTGRARRNTNARRSENVSVSRPRRAGGVGCTLFLFSPLENITIWDVDPVKRVSGPFTDSSALFFPRRPIDLFYILLPRLLLAFTSSRLSYRNDRTGYSVVRIYFFSSSEIKNDRTSCDRAET